MPTIDQMRELRKNERTFLERSYIARIATCSRRIPHVTPIYFASDKDSVFFATEETTRKFKDVNENDRVSLVVDEFDADWLHGDETSTKTYEKAIVISGRASIFRSGDLYVSMYKDLLRKYPDYKTENRWELGELPIIRIKISKIISWGLD
jgi:nitroimidazol reductase NimA-like FMN-containing flavoprotein (pyridoxamine 5'-phosphate oxidase superfamily)